MILFFIIGLSICGVTLWCITQPLFKKENAQHIEKSDVEYFTDQLKTLEKTYAKEDMKEKEYISLYAEISRALLRAKRETEENSIHNFGALERRTIWTLWLILPLMVFPLYVFSGSLGMPDFPIKNRSVEIAQAEKSNNQTVMITNMVKGLEARLNTTEKNNIDGWKKLAKSYGVLRNYEKQIMALKGWAVADSKNPLPLLLQARIIRAGFDDHPTAKSFALMEQVLWMDKNNIEALFLSALYLHQNKKGNVNGYTVNQRLKTLLNQFDKKSVAYKKLKQKIEATFK